MKPNTQKMIETKKANAALYASQTIKVDEDWSIVRLDKKNWHIQFKNSEDENFYGTLTDAVQRLPHKMLDECAKGSLKDVVELVKGIRAKIAEAMP